MSNSFKRLLNKTMHNVFVQLAQAISFFYVSFAKNIHFFVLYAFIRKF